MRDLKEKDVAVPKDDFVNYGFARLNDHGAILFFLNDCTKVETLFHPHKTAVLGTFTMRRRNNYPTTLDWQKIVNLNKPKNQKKFLSAISSGDVSSVTNYLRKGLDPNFSLGKNQDIPIFRWLDSSNSLQDSILDALVLYGAHLDFKNSKGECVQHIAVSRENRQAVKLLHSKGASFHEWEQNGLPVMFRALSQDIHISFLEFLLELEPRIDMVDLSGNNALHFCVKMSLENHLSLLLKHLGKHLGPQELGKYVSAYNKSGNAPVHHCVIQGHKGCLRQFGKIPGCLELRNAAGETVLNIAARMQDFSMMKLIKEIQKGHLDDRSSLKSYGYDISLEYCKQTYGTLKKNRKSRNVVIAPYPAVYTLSLPYSSSSAGELNCEIGEMVYVILLLKTNIGFGYKIKNSEKIYGWFPANLIKMGSEKQIKAFQKNVATFYRISSFLPSIYTTFECSFVPVMVFISLQDSDKSLGVEIGYRSISSYNSKVIDSLSVQASPYYVRFIFVNSPAERGGLRIGDQILYIMSNEVTTLDSKITISLIKKLCTSKLPSNMSKVSRQIVFIVLRHDDDAHIRNIDFTNTVNLTFDSRSTSENSPFDGLSALSVELDPYLVNSNFESLKKPIRLEKSYSLIDKRGPHCRPLPQIPQPTFDKELPPPTFSSDDKFDDDFEDFPPPPPPLDFK